MAGKSMESLQELIHKKKEPKKKLKTKGLLSIELKKDSTKDSQSQQLKEQQTKEAHDRSRSQRINAEIDEKLEELIATFLIKETYKPFFAKACHTLGLNKVNKLAIESRNGKDQEKLFAYLVNGAMKLHFKKEYFKDNSGIAEQ